MDTNTVIEGSVKFRDGKKWKSRWGVMRKLSPVADCLHLQLYRDSKDRYKHGQTKASLSLQHFLGVQTGFTLDKESNTIAIICQDVTVVLAFDTRERLIQWQVKIANNLGEDEQFLVQISSAPLKAKLSPGPALLHVLQYHCCLTVGVPPRLFGCWQINQLRRYGVVESRFCFEGGSRCGKGEGLYVLVTDQGDEITRTFRLAAEGKLLSKKRPASRNASDSPKKSSHGRAETRMSELSGVDNLQLSAVVDPEEGCCECGRSVEDVLNWQTSENLADFADTSSVTDFKDSHSKETSLWLGDSPIERCASCISKLGALSRSSTAAMTPNSSFTPAWTMEANTAGHKHEPSRNTESSDQGLETSQICDSSTLKGLGLECWNLKDDITSSVVDKFHCSPPVRPPKPGYLSSSAPNTSVSGSPKKKHPIPPDTSQPPSCSCNITVNPYDNYDIPKATQEHSCLKDHNSHWVKDSVVLEQEYYDTPKNIRENFVNDFGNYDVPPPPPLLIERKQMCTSLQKNQYLARVVIDSEDMQMMACPCQRMMCWAENWMFFPYCRRGNGRENTAPPLHKKEVDYGVHNSHSNSNTVYAAVDKSKKIRYRQCSDKLFEKTEEPLVHSIRNTKSFSESVSAQNSRSEVGKNEERLTTDTKQTTDNVQKNYMNFDFVQSLEFYENSKDLMHNVQHSKRQTCTADKSVFKSVGTNTGSLVVDSPGVKICTKCKHDCKWRLPNSYYKQDDYLMMEPYSSESTIKGQCGRHVPGYIPMHPIGSPACINTSDLVKLKMCQQLMCMSERAASTPSLNEQSAEIPRKRSESDCQKLPFLGLNHSVSATNSPYLKRRVLGCLHESSENENSSGKVNNQSCTVHSRNTLEELDSHTAQTTSATFTVQGKDDPSRNISKNNLCNTFKKMVDFDIPIHMFKNDREKSSDKAFMCSEEQEASSSKENSDCVKLITNEPYVHIRRSSSVPSKSSHNRDSSSSNDSGVSTSSMKKRKAAFKECDVEGCHSGRRRYTYTINDNKLLCECFHSSLPRRSKSVDPLRDLAFQFQQVEMPMKSSSAEAEVPICHSKPEARGCLSPGVAVPYIDSRSTSSGTSDMSDYFETLSLSSFSSSDTPESIHFGHHTVSTMRPRSGNEYQKIDRNILESELKKVQLLPVLKQEEAKKESKGE